MVNWRTVPFIRLIIPLILGVGISFAIPESRQTLNWGLAFLWGMMAFLAFRSVPFSLRWIFGLALTIFLVLLGFQLGTSHLETNHRDHFSRFADGVSAYAGTIVEMPEVKERSVKLQVDVEYLMKVMRFM